MSRLAKAGCLALAAAVWFGGPTLLATSLAQDDKKPAKKAVIPLEDCLKRAALRAKRMDENVLRITAAPTLTSDESNYVVLVEFGTGTFGIYQGFVDPADDQFVVIEKRELEIFKEGVERAKSR